MMPSPDYRLRFLGGASIEGPEGPLTGRVAQRNALALMAVLATAPDHDLPRDTITALLWPERETKRARHLLNVTAYEIRKALGEAALVTANSALQLNPSLVASDAETFYRAVEKEAWERAETLYAGPFLDGFHFDGSEPFERWVERERWRYERLYRTVLERLAEDAEEPAKAAERWRALLERDPASATATLGLMRALESTGARAEAIDAAHAHRTLLLDEYGADPNPDVEALADRLREAPVGNGPPDPVDGTSAGHPLPKPRRRFRLRAATAAVATLVLLAVTVAALKRGGVDAVTPADARDLSGKILFTSNRSGSMSLWSMNPDGTGDEDLGVTGFLHDVDPTGRRVAYTSFGQIFVVDLDGGAPRVVAPSPAQEVAPRWSPDGERLLFWSNRTGHAQLWTVRPNGQRPTQLTTVEGLEGDWSPDGKRIVFRREGDLYVMNADGSDPVRIVGDPRQDANPRWSPDGHWIAFDRKMAPGDFDIFVVRPDGTEERRLTGEPVGECCPTWSPDSRSVAFSSSEPRPSAVYRIDIDGTRHTRLTEAGWIGGAPVWVP